MPQDVNDAPDPAGQEFLDNHNAVEKLSPDTTADAPAIDAGLISTDPTPSSGGDPDS
jgi:hypothetical protein